MMDSEIVGRQFGVVGLETRKVYRIVGPAGFIHSTTSYTQRSAGYFEIDPAGANNSDILFLGYLSVNWIWPRDWVTNTAYDASTIRSGSGYVYFTSAGGTSGATRPSHSSGSASDGAVTWAVYTEPYLANVANTALNDADLCLFDDDLMIDGMVWAYKRAKGQDYLDLRQDWENAVKSAVGRFSGPIVLNMCGDDFDDEWPLVQPGSWSV